MEPERFEHSTTASGRDLRAERLRDRYGHDRNLAVRETTGRSSGHAIPVDVSRSHGDVEREEVPHRITQRS